MRKFIELLLTLEIGFVAGLVALAFLISWTLPWAVAAALAFALLRWLLTRRLTLRTPMDGPVLLILLMTGVSARISAWPEVTLPQVYRLLSGIGLFYALVNWIGAAQNRWRLRWVVFGLMLLTLGLEIFAFFGVRWVMTGKLVFLSALAARFFPTLVGDAANPNVMGGSLAILLPLVVALPLFSLRQLRWYESGLAILTALLGAGILFLTQSRAGLLAGGIAIGLLCVLRWRRAWRVAVMVGLAVGIVFAWLGAARVFNLMFASTGPGSLAGRQEIWSRAIYMLQDFPLTGVGMGAYGRVADLLYPFFIYSPGTIDHAHHLLLQVAVDLGIPGMIAWFAAWLLILSMSWQLYRTGLMLQNSWLAGVGAGVFASQVALLLHGQLDAVTWGMVRPAPIVWAVWGMAAAACYVERKSQIAFTTLDTNLSEP